LGYIFGEFFTSSSGHPAPCHKKAAKSGWTPADRDLQKPVVTYIQGNLQGNVLKQQILHVSADLLSLPNAQNQTFLSVRGQLRRH
jgi:hypothetical protein